MVFGYGKSKEDKINDVYSNFSTDIFNFMKISKEEEKLFVDPLFEYVIKYLDVYENSDGKIIFDVYPYVSAKEIQNVIEETSKKLSFSQEETEIFTDLIIYAVSILQSILNGKVPKIRPSEMDEIKNVRIEKDKIYEEFGKENSFGLFKKKIFDKDVYGYCIIFHILETSNAINHLENYLRKTSNSDNRVGGINMLKDLLEHDIKNNVASIPLFGSNSEISVSEFKIPAYYLGRTCTYETYVEFKKNLLNKIEEFYNPQNLDEYIDAFLEITGVGWDSKLPSLIQIFREKNIPWRGNILEKILQRRKLIEINAFKRRLSDERIMPNVRFMNGIEFERFLGKLFEKMGYSVEVTKASGDQGADLIIKRQGEVIAVQAKQYSQKVDNTAVQEIVGSLKFYNATQGMVVTTNDFTKSAYELAASNNIELVDGEKLDQFISKYW